MTIEQAIKTAARWWRDKISKKPHHDNGDMSFASMMAGIMADSLAEDISDEKLDKFEEELIKILDLEVSQNCLPYTYLSCDYGPGLYLSDAADIAGINYSCFPWKTNLQIIRDMNDKTNYEVLVSDGYRASWVSLEPVQEV